MQARTAAGVLVFSSLALAIACGGGTHGGEGTTAANVDLPAEISGGNYAEAVRTFHTLPLDSAARTELRARLLRYLGTRTDALTASGDYDAVVDHFARMTSLYTPAEMAEGRIGRELAKPARYLLTHGSPRGDEPRVLSARLVLRGLDGEHRDDHARAYRQLSQWGRDARSTIDGVLERYGRLIEVWEEHARLTPTAEVLTFLSRLYAERRDAVMSRRDVAAELLGPGGRFAPALVRNAPFEVAAPWLRHGEIASAVTQLEGLGDGGELQVRLVGLLRIAQSGGDDGDEALLEIAEAFREARPDVALGLCRLGYRRSPEDARFAVCLARTAAAELRHLDATAWYARAIELAPTERRVYDEALEQLDRLIEEGLFDPEASNARELATKAETILEQRMRRWPNAPPPLAPDRLQLLIGQLDMNSGDTEAARRRFRASIDADENAEALLQLAFLEERTGNGREALTLYRRALDLTPQDRPSDAFQRARILEHLGDAFTATGDARQAERMYRQALEVIEPATEGLEGLHLAHAQLRRGVLLDRLGRHDEAVVAFRRAMAAAPHWKETYSQILSHLVVTRPDLPFAREVFRTAQNQLTLEPEWRVYFALWLSTIAGRSSADVPPEAREVLAEMSQGEAWWGRLAKFGAGDLPYEELLAEADNTGQRAEANFYQGTKLLARGDGEGARTLFRRVLESGMVMFYEFAMAQALLGAEQPGRPATAAGTTR